MAPSPSVPRATMHLVIDAVGTRPDSGGAVVLGDILRAAAQHPRIARTTVFVSRGVELGLALSDRQRTLDITTSRPRLLWWNAHGLEQHAAAIGAQAILSLSSLGRSRRIPIFLLFQQQLMFAPRACERMSSTFRWRLALMRRLCMTACQNAALVFAQAEHVRENLSRHFHLPPRSLCVVPPDVSWTELPNEAIAREEGLVAYVGSSRPYKSLDTLFTAFGRLRVSMPEASLHVTLAQDAFQPQPGVTALGRLPRGAVRQLLRRAQVMVMPSLAETVGLPLLEAMDAGCAVVSADLPYAREASGEAALYFAPGDAAACAARIQSVCQDASLRATLAERGRNLLAERRARTPYKLLLDELALRIP
jgi:glycosyltransferase involved in cell wall biosynthesis